MSGRLSRPLPPVPPEDDYLTPIRRDYTYDKIGVSPDCMIEVSNLPPKVSCDGLELFFENKKEFGRTLSVQRVQLNPEGFSAIITFDTIEDVRLVLEKHEKSPCVYGRHELRINPIVSHISDIQVESNTPDTDTIDSDTLQEAVDTIEVQGFKENCTEDGLKFYFENSRRSGGGDIVSINFCQNKKYLIIKFLDHKVVQSVLAKNHKVEGCVLSVRPFIVSKTDLLLEEVPVDASEEHLMNFLEAKLKMIVTSVTLNSENRKALVSFEKAIDFNKVADVCQKFKINNVNMKLIQVPITSSILITDLPKGVTESGISLYFENIRRSNGGDVMSTELQPDCSYCVLTFKDASVVPRVCKKTDHKIDGQLITVKPYIELFGLPNECEKIVHPGPLTLEAFDENKLKFFQYGSSRRMEFELQLKEIHAEFVWDEKPFQVDCLLDVNNVSHKPLFKTWSDQVVEVVEKFTNLLEVKIIQINRSIWSDCLVAMRKVKVSDKNAVNVFPKEKEGIIVLVADENKIAEALAMITDAVGEVENREKKRKSSVEKRKDLETWKLQFLIKSKFKLLCEEIIENLKVDIDLDKQVIVFIGEKGTVDDAMIKMFECLQKVSPNVIHIGTENGKLIQNESVEESIKEILAEDDITYVWTMKDDRLTVYCEDIDFHIIETAIWKKLVKITIPLDSGMHDVLQSKEWKATEKKLRENLKGCVEITEEKDVLCIYTLDTKQEEVSDKLREFLSKNTVYKEQMSIKPEIVRYITKAAKGMFEQEMKKLSDVGLKNAEFNPMGGVIAFEGTAEGIKAGKSMIQRLQNGIYRKQHTIKLEKVGQYLASSKGKQCIEKVEALTPCCIQVGKSSLVSSVHSILKQPVLPDAPARFSKIVTCAEVTHSTGAKLVVCGGDITSLKVDVLVNAANKELQHVGGLAKIVASKGGKAIVKECEKVIKKNGRLNYGEVFVSGGGKLSCEYVAHAAGPCWNGGNEKEEFLLRTTVINCLKAATDRKMKTIAIPALCTGIFNYPVDMACSTIVTSVIDYIQKTSTDLTEVIFCDINGRTVNGFITALQSVCTDINILGYESDASGQSDKPAAAALESKKENGKKGKKVQFGKMKVEVVKGIIAKEKVDVIIDSTSMELDLKKGALSNALLRAGGDVIQDECNQNYPNGISPGEVAVTSGGNLACTYIFHIAIRPFDSKHPSKSLQSVSDCLTACLKEASRMKLSSISIPAIGTGAQQYPKDRVAKEMFQCVANFMKGNARTSLTLLRFVIFTADTDIFELFMKEEKKYVTNIDRPISAETSGIPLGHIVKEERGRVEFKIGKLRFLVYQGDITEVYTDVVVASCNLDLDLTQGAVTKALLKKGGKDIAEDCKKQKKTMRQNGLVITTAGKLHAKHILFVDTKRNLTDWKDMVLNALKLAESQGLKSISFPALGTSVKLIPIQMAHVICEGISDFKNSNPNHIKEVRLVIFQEDMVTDFIEGCKQSVKGQPAGNHFGRRHSSQGRQPHDDQSKSIDSHDSQVVTIYAENEEKGSRAVKTFERLVREEWVVKDMNDHGICTLNFTYIQKIKKDAANHHVEVKVNNELGTVHLVGLSENVQQVCTEVFAQLRNAEKSVNLKNQAQLLSNIVRWMFLKDNKTYPFPDKINLEIETAYKNKRKTIKVKIGRTSEFEIDFNNMVETDVNNSATSYPVIRRDLLQGVSADLPKSWSHMNATEDLKLVMLNQQQKEYNDVLKHFEQSLGRKPNIVSIERIQNRTLYTQYAAKHKLLDQTYPKNKNEKILWHGTADYAVASINAQGFNRSYCGKNAVAIGNGVYFAVNANYSDQSTYTPVGKDGNKRMYRCRVLTGKYCNGAHGMRVPPPINQSQPHILYDSVTNNCLSPMMFVIFNDTQAYPEHIITYK
ncbi:Poly (ADP-ribose) polymerase [Mactra antiquata]